MKYFATAKHHSQVGYWEELNAKTLAGAKREASKRFGGGLIGSVIHLVKVEDEIDRERINDLSPWTKVVSSSGKWEKREY